MARIAPFAQAGDPVTLRAEIEAIFFDSAATKSFASEDKRAAYLDLWLDRYLRHSPQACFVALDDEGTVVGYLAGSPVSDRQPLPGPDYYALFPNDLIEAYPAHLHVNVHKDFRGHSIGSQLMAVFSVHCQKLGVCGLHAVTAAESRAASFFQACGLKERATTIWRNRKIVFLAKALT